MALSFDDLMAEAVAESKAKGLEFVAKGGETVLIRPLLLLSKTELKNIMALLKRVENDEADIVDRLDSVDAILVAAADRKEALKRSLAELPPAMRTRVFEAWMQAADLPEA